MPAFFLKKLLLLFLLFLFMLKAGYPQTNLSLDSKREIISLKQQLRPFYDIATLPQYLTNTTVAQTSTYVTTGGNNYDFNGTYSFISKDANSNLVIFDIKRH